MQESLSRDARDGVLDSVEESLANIIIVVTVKEHMEEVFIGLRAQRTHGRGSWIQLM